MRLCQAYFGNLERGLGYGVVPKLGVASLIYGAGPKLVVAGLS